MMLEGPTIEENILPKSSSDQWLVQLWIDTIVMPKFNPFHFEKLWLNLPDLQELSQSWWEKAEISHGSLMYKFQQRLKNFKMKRRD